MKQLLLLFALATLLSFVFTSKIQASAPDIPEPTALSECAPFAPDLPGLPQEEDFLCGDVNEDGLVNVLDIISTVNYIMGGNPSPFNTDAADVNADGGINVLDIIALVNIIMQVPGMPCGCVAPVLYEGQTYSTVQIGSQCWLKENLNVGTMIISNTGGQLQTDNSIIEKYCYDNVAANCTTYGGLYEWNEAMHYTTTEGAQGICPLGWHLPTDNEWKGREGPVESQYPVGDPEWDGMGTRGLNAGGNLKATGTIEGGDGLWYDPNTGATNASGFTGIPGAYRDSGNGNFDYLGITAFLWTSSKSGTGYAWHRGLDVDNSGINRIYPPWEMGMSIRCLKDCTPQPTWAYAGPDQINILGTSTILEGNTPTSGIGEWNIVSGTGGMIVNASSPTSEFQGLVGHEYILSWTITTICASSVDDVVIRFVQPCPDIPTVIFEDQTYHTVLIGSQCWFIENLNAGTMINGITPQSNNDIIEKYCYDDNLDNCSIYGGLYCWNEAMQYVINEGAQGICPDGWYMPPDNEWMILEGTLDTQYPVGDPEWEAIGFRGFDAGGHLKEKGMDHWNPNIGATNKSGFKGLPGGYRSQSGSFGQLGIQTYFWSSTQISINIKWIRTLAGLYATVGRGQYLETNGYSVRCFKNCEPQPTQSDAGPDQLNVPGTSTTLAGNTPTYGTGVWHIISGTGGAIADTTSPISAFTGLAGNTYSLTWTITTQCGSTEDTVAISFASGFTCGDLLIDDRDWTSYNTVLIGTQCWMAQNLNIGEPIASNSGGQLQTDNGIIEKYCYGNSPSMCSGYGGLYEWNEAMQYVTAEGAQGICPAGWHIPTDNEWKILEGTVDSQYPVGDPEWDNTGWRGFDAGGNLKKTGTENWNPPNVGATNSSGFTALGAGFRGNLYGFFDGIYITSGFWSSSQSDPYPQYRGLGFDTGLVDRYIVYMADGYSVRCLKDD